MNDNALTPAPPMPSDASLAHQWEHSRLRRRLLYGQWQTDLDRRLISSMGTKRAEVLKVEGRADMSANPFLASITAASALYDIAPKIAHADSTGLAEMQRIIGNAALWALMQRVQRDTLGMRECLVRVDVLEGEDGQPPEVRYRPVFVDLVELTPDPSDPERPIAVREAVLREERQPVKPYKPTGRHIWTYDVWDTRDGGIHKVLSTTNRDLSEQYGLPPGGARGDRYPALDQSGRPFLPYVLYHAARTGYLLDSFHGLELVEGALNVGVLWTFFTHCVRNNSWPQRYTIGLVPMATDMEGAYPEGQLVGDSDRLSIKADPSLVLQLTRDPDFDGQGSVGQWAPASDPKSIAEAIGLYERRISAFAGLNPADVQRISGDPRSGYALAVTREGRREAQRKYAPIFEPADQRLLSVTAKLINAAVGGAYLPESGWGVEYQALPPSPEEQEAARDRVFAMLDRGLITEQEARRELGLEDRTNE